MNEIDNYRVRIWLQDYIRNAKATVDTLTEEAKKCDPKSNDFEDLFDSILAMDTAINKATRALWDLEKKEGVEDFYNDCER